MSTIRIPPHLTVEEIQRLWPATIAVFLRRRMACVGCPMAGFDTISDIARTYGISADDLRAELERAVREGHRAS